MIALTLLALIFLESAYAQSANFSPFVPPVVTKAHPRFIITPKVREGFDFLVMQSSRNVEPQATWLNYIGIKNIIYYILY